jgi:MFS family permease
MPRTIYILSLCQALMMSGNALMVTVAALVGSMLAEDKSLATLPLALQFLATMLSTIPASLMMGRFGRKTGFLFATVMGMSGGALAVYAILYQDFWLFCLAALLLGIFNAFGGYYRFAAAEDVDEEHRSRAISYVLAGGIIAAFLGPNLANYGQNLILDARFAGSFVFIIVFYGLSMLLISFAKFDRTTVTHPSHAGRPLPVIARQPKTIVAIICAMLGYAVMSLIMTATPLAMDHQHHQFNDTAFVIQWHVLGMFAPSFFTGHIIRRIGVARVLWLGAILATMTIGINLLGSSFWHFMSALILLGISWNFLFIGGTTLLTETYTPEERAKTQAMNDFLVFTATFSASLSAGALLHLLGWWWVNVAVIPLVLIIILGLALLGLSDHRKIKNHIALQE